MDILITGDQIHRIQEILRNEIEYEVEAPEEKGYPAILLLRMNKLLDDFIKLEPHDLVEAGFAEMYGEILENICSCIKEQTLFDFSNITSWFLVIRFMDSETLHIKVIKP